VAFDLDGTLLNSRHGLSERTSRAVRRLGASGVRMVLVSGRMHVAMRPWAQRLGIREPLISYNGALVKGAEGEEVLYHLPVPREMAVEVVEYAVHHRLHFNLYFEDVWYVPQEGPWTRLYAERTGVRPVIVPRLGEWVTHRSPTKIILIDQPDTVERLHREWLQRAQGRLYITTSEPEYLEFLHPKVSKGAALQRVCAMLGVDCVEAAAFGDGRNDRSLLEAVGYGVAMANAHPDTKAVADYITATNDEDGVALVVEKWLE